MPKLAPDDTIRSPLHGAPAAAPSHAIVPEDHFTLATVECIALSPGGRFVAFREARWSDKEYHDHLCVVETATGKCRRLTRQPTLLFAPQWSPGEDAVYFAAAPGSGVDDPGLQIWRADPGGGGITRIAAAPGGISRFVLGETGRTLYYTKHVAVSLGEWRELRARFANSVVSGHGTRLRTEVWKHDLERGDGALLHDHERYISSFAVSPDEKKLALVTAPDEHLISNEGQSGIEILNTGTGALTALPDDLWREDAPSPHAWVETPAWAPDSARLAFRIACDAFPPEVIVADLSEDAPRLRQIARPFECHPLKAAWHPDGRNLVFTASHRAGTVLLSVDPDAPSAHRFLAEGDVVIGEFSLARVSGRLAVLKSTPDTLPEIFLLGEGRDHQPLSAAHKHTADWRFPSLSRFTWDAPDGASLEGVLELPPGYEPGNGRLPVLVILHGGPTAAAQMGRVFDIRGRTAFAARGYAVFSPNFRGSAGYGDAFLTGLVGRTNAVEIEDILSGIDALIAEGIGDPNRLGMMGWSYGGYLVNCLLATNRFKAASSGAGTIDMGLQFADMDTPGQTINLLGARPWEDPAEYQRSSPLYCLKPGIKTATLIHAGGNDRRVPAAHARALHRVLDRFLDRFLDAPCELVVYSGAGHRLETHEHQEAQMTWDHAWFAKYLA